MHFIARKHHLTFDLLATHAVSLEIKLIIENECIMNSQEIHPSITARTTVLTENCRGTLFNLNGPHR